VRLAGEEARELRHSFIGTEHLLLALAREPQGTAAQALATVGVDHARIRTAVVGMMGLGVEAPEGELAFTGRARDVIDRARAEAAILDQPQVGTEHILLALVHDQSGAAARILLQLDVDPAAIRAALAS
jgi:ATP-dependent Clp protease ATP-binding subunit ClpC